MHSNVRQPNFGAQPCVGAVQRVYSAQVGSAFGSTAAHSAFVNGAPAANEFGTSPIMTSAFTSSALSAQRSAPPPERRQRALRICTRTCAVSVWQAISAVAAQAEAAPAFNIAAPAQMQSAFGTSSAFNGHTGPAFGQPAARCRAVYKLCARRRAHSRRPRPPLHSPYILGPLTPPRPSSTRLQNHPPRCPPRLLAVRRVPPRTTRCPS